MALVNPYFYVFSQKAPSFVSGKWAWTKEARRIGAADRPLGEAAGFHWDLVMV